MSESTQETAAPAPETAEESHDSISDILNHLPPEVAQALGKTKSKAESEPEPKDAEEEETEAVEPEESEESTDDQSEDKKDDEEEEEAPEGEEDKSVKKLEKRIDKLTRRRKEAETAAESLRAENENLKAEVEKRSAIKLEPTAEDPLADMDSTEDLETKVTAAKKVRAWALQNPDGATVTNPDGTERYVDRAEIARYIAQTESLLTDHAPARREYLRQREIILPEAKAIYPALFKTGSPEHKVLIDTLKQVPALKRLPGYEMVIGDAILGMSVRLEKTKQAAESKGVDAKKSAPPATRKVIAPAIPKSSASRPPAASTKGKSNRFDRVVTGGSVDDLAAYFGG
jgi:hypothetical protein